MDVVSEGTISELLPLVSDQRREEALKYKHLFGQFACLKSYVMLRELLEQQGLSHPFIFVHNEHGKPFLKDHPEVHFNLSHCPGAALCVVAPAPVGCDIEAVPRRLDMELCAHVCSDAEISAILAHPAPALAFIRLWTRKEAFLKYTGEGLSGNLKELLLHPDAQAGRFISEASSDNAYVWSVFSM